MIHPLLQGSLWTAILWTCSTALAPGITPEELAQNLAQGQFVNLIDVRPKTRFETGSIPGAMSIPASIILEKKLPPLAPVVLFDDGLGGIDVAAIATALNQRPGWRADVLVGGFSAWRVLKNAPDTSPAGLRPEDVQHITYEDLNKLNEAVVLVDMRPVDPAATNSKTKAAPGMRPGSAKAPDPVTDFCTKRPNRAYLPSLTDFRSRFHATAQSQGKTAKSITAKPVGPAPLIVLIDAANADNRETCRRLRAEGYGRVLILAGGDESIRLEGRHGIGRVAGVVGQGQVGQEPAPQPPSAKP